MIVDTSVLLAIYFKEVHCAWALNQLKKYEDALYMSTVNLAEVLIHLEERHPKKIAVLQDQLLASSLVFIPPSVKQAQIAAAAHLQFPLNLGDCFVYALAKEKDLPILTLDKDFKATNCKIVSPNFS